MNTDKIIFTDADGVLLDWLPSFERWMSTKGYTKQMSGEYDLDKLYGIPKDLKRKLTREFNESEWIAKLDAFRGAKDGIDRLNKAGYKFVVITSLSDNPRAAELRKKNLIDLFGTDWMIELVCLDTGADKDKTLAEYVKKYPTARYWAEDKPANIDAGNKVGLVGFLIEHDHNESHEGYTIVSDMSEVATKILRFDTES